MYMCVSVYTRVQMPTEDTGAGSLELGYRQLTAALCGCWKFNSGPVEEQQVL